MPKYMVTGADMDTAEDREMEIEADSESEAADAARKAGLLAHRTYPIDGPAAKVVKRATDAASSVRSAVEISQKHLKSKQKARAMAAARDLEAQREVTQPTPIIVKASLRSDFETVATIGCGVALGAVILWAASFLMLAMILGWGIFGASATDY